MNAATHKAEGNAKVPMLYMALELSTRVPRTESQDIAAVFRRSVFRRERLQA